MNWLGLKHWIFAKKNISKPIGINVLSNFNIRHYDKWDKNLISYPNENKVVTTPTGVILLTDPDTVVYFDWNTWNWSNTKQNNTDQKFTCASGRIDTEDILTVDIYKPGKITSYTAIPQKGAVFAIWLYFEEHPHDKHHPTRDIYFEVDAIESEPSKDNSFVGAVFTNFLGTNSNSLIGRRRLKRKLDKYHHVELSWDGSGEFTWKLDGVTMRRNIMRLEPDLKPYIICSIGTKQLVSSNANIKWLVYSK